MQIKRMPLGCYGANSYILTCLNTKEAVVVDPGGESEDTIKVIEEENLDLKYIILTHGHGDHIGGVLDLKEKYGAPILIHELDEELINDSEKNLSVALPMKEISFKSDKNLKDGEIVSFGNVELEVLHTPGHSQGCICLKSGKDILTGDTLFRGSIGRTDLYGSLSQDDLINSVNEKIMVLEDDDINFHPGHGAESTMKFEKENNPFFQS